MEDYLKEQIITYIGNKRKLIDFINEGIEVVRKDLQQEKFTTLDGFAGSGVVSRYLKQVSTTLHSNDFEYYSYLINKVYLRNKSEIDEDYVRQKIDELNNLKLRTDLGTGIIEKLYAPKDDNNIQEGERVFYTNQNAKIIDNIRRSIDLIVDREEYKDILIAPLLYKASVHNNTGGVFKGFYKNKKGIGQFGGEAENALTRIKGEIELPYPIWSPYECEVITYQEDINTLIKKLPEVDIVYYDPPYNEHPYGSNYHMLNTIATYKEPKEVSKVAGIPTDWQKSTYNKKKTAINSFDELFRETKAKYILLSYNDEGILNKDEMTEIVSKYGEVNIIEKDYNTYRASRNLNDRDIKVKELLYVIKPTNEVK